MDLFGRLPCPGRSCLWQALPGRSRFYLRARSAGAEAQVKLTDANRSSFILLRDTLHQIEPAPVRSVEWKKWWIAKCRRIRRRSQERRNCRSHSSSDAGTEGRPFRPPPGIGPLYGASSAPAQLGRKRARTASSRTDYQRSRLDSRSHPLLAPSPRRFSGGLA